MFALDKPFTWLVILVIILLIFGAGKLPEVGRSLGKSIKEFKVEAKNPLEDEVGNTTTSSPVHDNPGLTSKKDSTSS